MPTVPYAPNIKFPVSDIETKEVMYGQQIELLCIADAVPPPEIIWLKVNQFIPLFWCALLGVNHDVLSSNIQQRPNTGTKLTEMRSGPWFLVGETQSRNAWSFSGPYNPYTEYV